MQQASAALVQAGGASTSASLPSIRCSPSLTRTASGVALDTMRWTSASSSTISCPASAPFGLKS
jgi:hypothetical protein